MSGRRASFRVLALLMFTVLAVGACGEDQGPIPSDPGSGTEELQIAEVVERYNTAARQVDGQTMCESVFLAANPSGRSAADCNVQVTTAIRRKPRAWGELTTQGAIRVTGTTASVVATQQYRAGQLRLDFELVDGRWFLVPFG